MIKEKIIFLLNPNVSMKGRVLFAPNTANRGTARCSTHRRGMKRVRKSKILNWGYSTNTSPYMSLSWEWSFTT